ncbi:MAG: GNAT family N-acetyltransferase [Gammaproteobacteria bacterium]|nr:MAG: GNAT family N-acetyltransferase [Gammaproteobacteria bacterium]UTW42777.1 GNAT family N-acetyltransferase [bacterium SCSIO 12844]
MPDVNIQFEKVLNKHKAIILEWFSKDHVKAFYYGEGLENTLNNLQLYCQGTNDNGHYSFDHWIAYYGNQPFGFLMTSPVTGPYDCDDDYNKWHETGKKIYTLDLLIGEAAFLNKGLADKMIKTFILNDYVDADIFLIDPEAANSKAIHVYEKVGFKKIAEFYPQFNQKLHIMMRLLVDDLKC